MTLCLRWLRLIEDNVHRKRYLENKPEASLLVCSGPFLIWRAFFANFVWSQIAPMAFGLIAIDKYSMGDALLQNLCERRGAQDAYSLDGAAARCVPILTGAKLAAERALSLQISPSTLLNPEGVRPATGKIRVGCRRELAQVQRNRTHSPPRRSCESKHCKRKPGVLSNSRDGQILLTWQIPLQSDWGGIDGNGCAIVNVGLLIFLWLIEKSNRSCANSLFLADFAGFESVLV
jgi:hypothetical protein